MKIELGMLACDEISGIIGVCVSRTEYLHDSDARITLQPKGTTHEGKVPEMAHFSERQLKPMLIGVEGLEPVRDTLLDLFKQSVDVAAKCAQEVRENPKKAQSKVASKKRK